MRSAPNVQQSHNDQLNRMNTQLENCCISAALTALEFGAEFDSQLAAKRAFSYNPNSSTLSKIYKDYATTIKSLGPLLHGLTEKISINEADYESWIRLGHIYLTLGDFPNSFSSYSRAQRLRPDNTDSLFWYAIGIVYQHFLYNQHARNCFDRIFESDPGFSFINKLAFRYAILQCSFGNYESALGYFEKAKQEPPYGLIKADVEFQIAFVYQKLMMKDHAQEIYRSLLHRYPNKISIVKQYLWFQFLYNELNESDLQAAMKTFPNDPGLLLIAARVAMKSNNITVAYENYSKCIHYWSESATFWFGLGTLYYNNNQKQDALIAFQRSLHHNDKIKEIWLNLGLINENIGDINEALRMYTKGKNLFPEVKEFDNRINWISASKLGHSTPRRQMDAFLTLDESRYFPDIPEVFSNEYIMAAPYLPPSSYDAPGSEEENKKLATYPRSLFA